MAGGVFGALSRQETLPVTELPAPGEGHGLVTELFNKLEAVKPFDAYNYGEWIRVWLPHLGMLGLISVENSYFRVLRLADVEDQPGDLADAKRRDRPA